MKSSSFLCIFYLVLVLSFGLTSCGKRLTPFSQYLYDDFNWSERELKQIQFYLSNDLVLWRDISSDRSRIEEGRIRIRSGRQIEEIIIKRGTPGTFIFSPKENRFAISFDPYNDNKYLMFGPDRNLDHQYVLLGRDWGDRFGYITYDGKVYQTETTSAFTRLMVDLSGRESVKTRRRVESGRTIRRR